MGSESPLKYTPVETIPGIVDGLKETFSTHKTRSVEFRKKQLTSLGHMVEENQDRIAEALANDLGRARHEAFLTEIWSLKEDIKSHLKDINAWTKPESISTSWTYWFVGPKTFREPKGTVLILGAWNYPWTITIGPLIGAIAAGCTVVVKPPEASEHSAALMEELLGKYLDSSAYRVVNGAVKETTALLDLQFDHIFYTGNGNVGKIIAQKAAVHLTPTTLELGGKSPVCVLPDADLKVAARRILWGKSLNSGQTCVAPDYLLIPSSIQDAFIAAFKSAAQEFYPNTSGDTLTEPNHPKIINQRHWQRIVEISETTKGELVMGRKGEKGRNESENKIGIQLYKGITGDDPLMAQEIFGPIFGIITAETPDDMVKFINKRDHPLALYVFTKSKKNVDYIRERTRSGQLVHNDTLIQYAVPGLPFGGVGPSGSGGYHGRRTFDTFSYERAFISVPGWYELLYGGRYRPFLPSKFKQMAMMFPTFKGNRPTIENTIGGDKAPSAKL